MATGPDHIVDAATANGTELIFTLVAPHVWPILLDVGHILFVTSLFAAVLAFHSTVTRYGFALGRERVLPAALGRTNPRNGAPRTASVIQSVIGLVVILGYAISGVDPLVYLFFWIACVGGLGVLILMLLTSIAVVGYFARHDNQETVWRRVVAPVVAAVGLGTILVATLADFHIMLGVDPGTPWTWIFPVSYLAVFLVGVAWAGWLKATRPAAYQAIGLGAHSTTMPSTTPATTYTSA